MWIIFVILVVLLVFALLFVIPTLKDIIHRPRFRLIEATGAEFHNWWQPCKNYKELMELYDTASDNFKSYPSGHTAEASILIVMSTFFPLANKKFEKYQLPAFLGACALVVFVALARILAAAHFLSDVSFGATITIALTVIANEVIMKVKLVQNQEEPVEENKQEEAQA